MLLCKFCNKECKNANSLRNHERLCPSNPDKQNTAAWTNKNGNMRKSKENQYTRAKRLGLTSPIFPESGKERIRNSNATRATEWHVENGKRISESVKKKVEEGTWHTSLARNMHIDYKGFDLHGTWELKYAQYLDSIGISWIRNKDSFSYVFEEKDRKYTPDFYLPETDEYVEIKGYKTEKDEAKWSQFPSHRKLKVLMKEQLRSLGIEI